MKTKDELVVELKKLGIAVTKDGKVAKADIEKILAANATAEENEEDLDDDDMTYDELKEHLGIREDGLGVLDVYMKKYQNRAKGPAALQKSLEDFKSDVEQYAMPAVDKMLSAIDNQ